MCVEVAQIVKLKTTNLFVLVQEVLLVIHLYRVENLQNKIYVIQTLAEMELLVNPEMTDRAVIDLFVLALKVIEEIH